MAPETKFVPVRVTGTLVPRTPLAGAMEVRVGVAALTVKTAAAVVPPVVVTVTLRAPMVAVAEIVKRGGDLGGAHYGDVADRISAEETFTAAPETKFEPVRVTGTVAPCTPLDGAIAVRVGPRRR